MGYFTVFSLVLMATVIAVNGAAVEKEAPFLDCPADEKQADSFNFFNLFAAVLPQPADQQTERISCRSLQLPNGCELFSISANSDWTNTRGKLPQCPEHLGVEFYLYTRENKEAADMLQTADLSIKNSHFDSSKPTKFVVHGFTDWAPSAWTTLLKDELLKADDFNVILVNWHNGAIGINFNFWVATANTRPTGAIVANLIVTLVKDFGAKYSDIHLIGHSMGGEVIGIVGKEVQRLSGESVGRLSGMDAAGPGFEDWSENVHLDKSDADFVDLIHSDTYHPGLGMKMPHGHVDFYANDAMVQPGCAPNPVTFEQMMAFADGTLESICSHARAYELYTYSINSCSFTTTDAAGCLIGYKATPECTGRHDFNTTGTVPFC